MLNNMLAARAAVAERRHQFESEADRHRLRRLEREPRNANVQHVRREHRLVFWLRARHA
jgi:hypothetical protein